MPDITLCENEDCPIKENCYRYLAVGGLFQSYANFEYKNGCPFFIHKKDWQKKEKK